MTKNKIIYENYNPDTKETTIIIKNKYGIFTGIAKLGAEEEKYNSTFAGGRYAELKAKCNYYKHRAKLALDKRNNYAELYFSLERSGEDYKNSAMRKIRKQIHVCEREVKYWYQRIDFDWKEVEKYETKRRDTLDKKNNPNNNEIREKILELIKDNDLGKTN